MKQVVMYQCEFCKKYFKTPDKHICKYDPKLKNCFSCKHNKGFEEDREYNGQSTIYLVCAAMDDTVNAREAKNIDCGDYEYCGGKWFENEYAKIREEKEAIETDGISIYF